MERSKNTVDLGIREPTRLDDSSLDVLAATVDITDMRRTHDRLRNLSRVLADNGAFTIRVVGSSFPFTPSSFLHPTLASAGLWPASPFLSGRPRTITGLRMSRKIQAMRDAMRRDLAQYGRAESVCAGSSMSPEFSVGDTLVFGPCHSPRRGDVVLLEGRTCLIVHRITARFSLGSAGWILHSGEDPGSGPHLAARWRIMGKVVEVREFSPS